MSERRGPVLVVEDDSATREGLLRFLEDEGYHAVGAVNGQDALETLETIDTPSLVLLDLMMPVMDGWQFLARRNEARGLSGTPIVLLSGLAFISGAPGVADFLSKPVNLQKLRNCLERFCGRAEPATQPQI